LKTNENTMIDESNPFIVVDPATFRMSKMGLVTGMIHIQINGRSFPEKDWDDFVIIILNWWLKELILSISKGADTFNCLFMDGPFSFTVKKDNSDNSIREIFFVHRHTGSQMEVAGKVPLMALIDGFLAVSKTTINSCAEKDWKGQEAEKLVSNYNTLRQMSKKLVV
jgi:hypothetical protein